MVLAMNGVLWSSNPVYLQLLSLRPSTIRIFGLHLNSDSHSSVVVFKELAFLPAECGLLIADW
jgi:hypothetical protein